MVQGGQNLPNGLIPWALSFFTAAQLHNPEGREGGFQRSGSLIGLKISCFQRFDVAVTNSRGYLVCPDMVSKLKNLPLTGLDVPVCSSLSTLIFRFTRKISIAAVFIFPATMACLNLLIGKRASDSATPRKIQEHLAIALLACHTP